MDYLANERLFQNKIKWAKPDVGNTKTVIFESIDKMMLRLCLV